MSPKVLIPGTLSPVVTPARVKCVPLIAPKVETPDTLKVVAVALP